MEFLGKTKKWIRAGPNCAGGQGSGALARCPVLVFASSRRSVWRELFPAVRPRSGDLGTSCAEISTESPF